MKYLTVSLLAAASLSAAPGRQTLSGIVSDDMCGGDGHSIMRMGSTDAECTKACVLAHGAAYVLAVGTKIYTLSDQKAPEDFAGQKVRVVGILDGKTNTIRVESIAADK